MTLTIDIHALHTLPPSNINRDDTGAPKSALFGGVLRQRVSSQAFKRAIRKDFEQHLDREKLGIRTKRVVDLIAKHVVGLDNTWTLERAREAVELVFDAAKIKLVEPSLQADDSPRGKETGYLLFLSTRQIENVAAFVLANEGTKPTKKDALELLDQSHSVDIAMFGRMVADAPDYSVDASVQVAHSIGVHESEPEMDFFTAVDDIIERGGEEAGAGMLGTVQMMSSTLYRYASIDFESLTENLGDPTAAIEASEAFLRSFIHALPTGKLNTFANWTLPELIYVVIRDTRAVSLVNAFETPVSATDEIGRREAAALALAAEARSVEQAYGLEPRAAWVVSLGELGKHFETIAAPATVSTLLSGVQDYLAEAAK